MIALIFLAAIPGQFIDNIPAFPKDRQRAVLEATVRITLPATREHGELVATGVVVCRAGRVAYVLTAEHVIAAEVGQEPIVSSFTEKTTPLPSANASKVAVVERIPDADLAVLRAEFAEPSGVLQICPRDEIARIGTPTDKRPLDVLTSGIGGSFDSPFLRRDRLTGLRRAKPGTTTLFFEAEAAPAVGRSGGPLVDDRGYLIGVCSGTRGGKGYYVSVAEIHEALGRKKLGWLADGKRPPGS
jgi:S1-C subfamily serine protease